MESSSRKYLAVQSIFGLQSLSTASCMPCLTFLFQAVIARRGYGREPGGGVVSQDLSIGAYPKNIPRSSDQRLQIFGVHLYGSMLVDQFECEYESDAAAFSHKSAANSLHDT